MDRTVIQLDKLQRLHHIAGISTQLTVEMDHYMNLAIAVDHYINDPSPEMFAEVFAAIKLCGERYPTYYGMREQLMELLISNGNLRRVDDSDVQSDQPKVDEVKKQPTTVNQNVISLADFKKKKVDNPN